MYHNLLVSNRAHGLHRVKSVSIQSFSNPYFPAFGLNTESIFQYSFQIRKIPTRKTRNKGTVHAVLNFP